MKRTIALFLAFCLMFGCFAGCTSQDSPTSQPVNNGNPSTAPEKRDVDLAFFTGKVETVDLIDEIIADFKGFAGRLGQAVHCTQNASSGGVGR